MKVGDLVASPHHTIRGIITEVGEEDHHYNDFTIRVHWFDGDDSIEWAGVLKVISASR